MGLKHIRTIFRVPAFLKRLFSRQRQTQIEQIHSKRKTALSPEKQEQLESLCNQLFKKKELIASGKLQFIGLAKIKKRMGRKWEGLSKIVYDTAEEVINRHMDGGDIFVRYKDDTYIIIFAHATPEESQLKAAMIAEEIRKKLFELDEKELRNIEIRQAVNEIRTEMLMEADFLEDMFGMMDNSFGDLDNEPEKEIEPDKTAPAPEVQTTEVGAEDYKAEKIPVKRKSHELPGLSYGYTPLWDTGRGALTTYLCLAREDSDASAEKKLFDAYKALYGGKEPSQKATLDREMLKFVAAELESMEKDGRKFFIVCPVQHETVYRMESYEEYKHRLSQIPLAQRKFLLLMVMDMSMGDKQPPKNAYWFAKPLRVFCPHVFAEVPLRQDINFNYLHNSGANVVGVRLNKDTMSEQDTINLLNNFGTKAKLLMIPKTFVLDVSSLSITTSAVCAGFDFLGGSAIHDAVERPDTVHRYRNEDLLTGLAKQE